MGPSPPGSYHEVEAVPLADWRTGFLRSACSEYFPCTASPLHSARWRSAACAAATLAEEPRHVFIAASCSARPKEKLSFHGTPPGRQTAFNRSVATTSLCPPERNTIPGTADGTARPKQRRGGSAPFPTPPTTEE